MAKSTQRRVRAKSISKLTAPGSPRRAKRPKSIRGVAEVGVAEVGVAEVGVAETMTRLTDRGEIATGGMGMIRRVFDTQMERTTALKIIDPQLAADDEMRMRFLDEARITGQLDHPNIVPVHDLIFDGGGEPRAFVMKLVDGKTLTDHIAQTPRTARDLTRLCAKATASQTLRKMSHSRHVIHRDLKPDNIMLGAFGQVYVMDWGCAHVLERKAKHAEGAPRRSFCDVRGTVIGTPGYMAPEQAWGKTDEIDERTDVFGLGGILFHILTGAAPYTGDTTSDTMLNTRTFEPRQPQTVVTDVRLPPALCRIAMRALSPDPAERYATASDLRGDVESFLRGGSFFDTRTFAPGELIVREGDSADEAYVITHGQAEVFREERGRHVSLRMLRLGDVFGEGALFAAGTRNASIVAVTEVTAVVVSRESIHDELALDSWMGLFVRALAVRYRDLEARRRVTSLANDHLRITSAIVDHLSRAGTWQGTQALTGSWSHLWSTIGPELRLTEAQVREIVVRTGDLHVDGDTITLRIVE
jgi:eukaryotic-like serine/threonine-protein kinase